MSASKKYPYRRKKKNCRALIEIYKNPLPRELAFKGGTALNKLYLSPQPRYSEDIDLVQVNHGPIKPIILAVQKALSFLGKSSVEQKRNNNTLKFKFETEIAPFQTMRLKVEINCREHFNVLGLKRIPLSVDNTWYSGSAPLLTYDFNELIGTKLRALYQESGRDGLPSYCEILMMYSDKRVQEFFIEESNPDLAFIRNVYRALRGNADESGDCKR